MPDAEVIETAAPEEAADQVDAHSHIDDVLEAIVAAAKERKKEFHEKYAAYDKKTGEGFTFDMHSAIWEEVNRATGSAAQLDRIRAALEADVKEALKVE